MGYRVSWIARSGTSTNELIDASQRSLTGERHECPDVGFYLLELPKTADPTWVILIADGSENYGDLDDSLAQSLSKDGTETLYFWCSDTVMATELIYFKNQTAVWSILYNCEDKTQQPEIKGDVPAVAHEILAELKAKQNADRGADYIYEFTADLGRRIVSFRHDMDLDTDDPEPFQVLGEPSRQRHVWWQFWK